MLVFLTRNYIFFLIKTGTACYAKFVSGAYKISEVHTANTGQTRNVLHIDRQLF